LVSNKRAPQIIEVQGGDQLTLMPKQTDDPPSFIPEIYLGHKQTLAFACGDSAKTATNPTMDKRGFVSCP
jgi:hypothetical protein